MKYNYVLIEENQEYLRYFFGGFINHTERQFLQMKNESFVVDVRDLNIKKKRNGKLYCFIIGGRIYEYYGNYLISYLRAHYPNCKIILELIDLVKRYEFETGNLKKWFDLVIVFEEGDAKTYNLRYFPMTYEYSSVKPYNMKSDFFFVGGGNQQKGRFQEVMKLYRILTEKGYECDFWLADVPKELQDALSGVHYGYLPFSDVLSHIESTKCIVEIVQKGMSSATIRLINSILYGKHLLTNVKTIENDEVYGKYSEHVHVISNDMDFSFINEKTTYDVLKARMLFSNDSFINNIEKII